MALWVVESIQGVHRGSHVEGPGSGTMQLPFGLG